MHFYHKTKTSNQSERWINKVNQNITNQSQKWWEKCNLKQNSSVGCQCLCQWVGQNALRRWGCRWIFFFCFFLALVQRLFDELNREQTNNNHDTCDHHDWVQLSVGDCTDDEWGHETTQLTDSFDYSPSCWLEGCREGFVLEERDDTLGVGWNYLNGYCWRICTGKAGHWLKPCCCWWTRRGRTYPKWCFRRWRRRVPSFLATLWRRGLL